MHGQGITIAWQAAREFLHRVPSWISRPSFGSRFVPLQTPEKLVIAPQDLRTADPTVAREIYSGRFFLAGHLVETGGSDPFTIRDAPLAWQRELHAFGWLRHLEADGSELSRSNAVALLSDWLANRFSRSGSPAWEHGTAARRLISWLCHSVPIVERLTPRQYHNWLRSIGFHIRFLRRNATSAPEGMARMEMRIALAYAALCTGSLGHRMNQTMARLDSELSTQIGSDGMHASRSPSQIADLLCILLPLRQAHARLGIQPSRQLVSSVDRLMVALKYLRLGDGNLARFNGVASPRSDLLTTILRYDDSPESHAAALEIGGFARLEGGSTIVLADVGVPPSGALSVTAHAGTLSFEMSSEGQLLMVNCGAPAAPQNPSAVRLARATAAHNTLVIEDTSSSRIYGGRRFLSLLAERFVSSPAHVSCMRHATHEVAGFVATHDGYRAPFGLIHERSLYLSRDGNRIVARDRLTSPSGAAVNSGRRRDYAIRFHLHPAVSAGLAPDGSAVLMLGRGLIWRFSTTAVNPVIEESAFFASVSGTKRTKQIVLYGNAAETSEVTWQLVREESAP